MATEVPIDESHGWFTGNDKMFEMPVVTVNSAVQDITAWSLSWKFKRKVDDPDGSALVSKATSGGGITLTYPTSGVCAVTISASDTRRLGAVQGVHELKRTDSGYEQVLHYGPALLQQGVHRS